MAKTKTKRRLGDHYKPQAYGYCIRRVCRELDIPYWSPNRLRHNTATRFRRDYGLDIAQVLLRHGSADVTQVYAEADIARAKSVMEKIG